MDSAPRRSDPAVVELTGHFAVAGDPPAGLVQQLDIPSYFARRQGRQLLSQGQDPLPSVLLRRRLTLPSRCLRLEERFRDGLQLDDFLAVLL